MNIWITYLIVAVILLVAELIYFRIADKCNLIDKPNERRIGYWDINFVDFRHDSTVFK